MHRNYFTTDNVHWSPRRPGTWVERIAPGIYSTVYMNGCQWFKKVEPEPIKIAPNTISKSVLASVDKFIQAKEVYRKTGFTYRRGFLLYGPPGTGKSTILRCVEQNVAVHGGVAIRLDTLDSSETGLITQSREIGDTTLFLIVLEDIDKYMEHDEEELCDFLDGSMNYSNTLILATTNHLEKLSERVKRASRLDEHIEVGLPSTVDRRAFVRAFIKDEDVVRTVMRATTDQSSLADVRSAIISHLLINQD